jgi:hypothetical protein
MDEAGITVVHRSHLQKRVRKYGSGACSRGERLRRFVACKTRLRTKTSGPLLKAIMVVVGESADAEW